jgi:hypothetical protein
MIRITDGIRTIEFQECAPNALGLRVDGFAQQVARWDESAGDYADVEESLELVWRDKRETARAELLHEFGLLQRKMRNFRAQGRYEDCVWLEAETPTETETRYAIVRDMWVPELDARHYAGARLVGLQVRLLREGAWRGVAPKAEPLTLEGGGVATIQMFTDTRGENYMDVPSGQGDAMPLYRIRLEQAAGTGTTDPHPTAMPNRFIIAAREERTGFDPHFKATDATFGGAGASVTVDDNAPDGVRVMYTLADGTGTTMDWPWPSDPELYRGRYHAYLIGKIPKDFYLQFTLQSQFAYERMYVQEAVAGVGNGVRPHYLGMVTFPYEDAQGSPWYGEPTTGTRDVGVTLFNESGASGTMWLWGMILVPVESVAFVEVPRIIYPHDDGWGISFVLDSIWRRADMVDGSDDILRSFPAPVVRGEFVRGEPGGSTTVWVWGWRDGLQDRATVQEEVFYNCENEMEMTVQYVPRFLTLRPPVFS